jgi:MFS family permease
MSAQESPIRPTHHGSLLVIFLTVFVDLLGFGMVLPLLPIYAEQFAVDESGWQLGLLMASFSAMQFLFAPMWGRLSDRYGRRPILMIGLAGSVIFYTLFGVASIMQSLALLFVSRIGAGIMGATISTAQAYIADTTTLKQRPRGMALIGMAFGIGFTFGPLLGFLAVPSGYGDPRPWPGFVAAALSLVALLLAIFLLPESLHAGSEQAGHKLLDLRALRRALSIPSIGAILLALFVCVFSFANFETTVSLLIWGSAKRSVESPFHFDWGQVCLTFALIGLTLSVVQGGIVRRLAGRVSEGVLASIGCGLELAGFLIVTAAIQQESVPLLLTALVVVVSGFSFMMPTLMSLLSRRSDPARQGAILGVGQSVSSLARILGSGLGIPLLKLHLGLPYYAAAGLMGMGLVLVIAASLTGKDFPS